MSRARVFVYGTLKRGLKYHQRYIPEGAEISEAWCWGRLYDLPAGYPALEIPAECILGEGSTDPGVDADMSAEPVIPAPADVHSPPAGDWDRIRGELVILDNPGRQLTLLDELEEFIPGGNGLYRRVLYPVHTEKGMELSWVYEYLHSHQGRRIPGGFWPAG